LVLVEGSSKKNEKELVGRNEGNKKVVLNESEVFDGTGKVVPLKSGDYVLVKIEQANQTSLRGSVVELTTLQKGALALKQSCSKIVPREFEKNERMELCK